MAESANSEPSVDVKVPMRNNSGEVVGKKQIGGSLAWSLKYLPAVGYVLAELVPSNPKWPQPCRSASSDNVQNSQTDKHYSNYNGRSGRSLVESWLVSFCDRIRFRHYSVS